MRGEICDMYTVTFLGTEYLCRTVHGDDGRVWDMADSRMGKLIGEFCEDVNENLRGYAMTFDGYFHNYVPLHVLVFPDDDKIMAWCRDNGIDFD